MWREEQELCIKPVPPATLMTDVVPTIARAEPALHVMANPALTARTQVVQVAEVSGFGL